MRSALKDTEYALLRETLRSICGIDVPAEKKYLFETRLAPALEASGIQTYEEFCVKLRTSGDEPTTRLLVESMVIPETSFFRDTHPFNALTEQVVPTLVRARRNDTGAMPPILRIWSAACSTGQEPYSIAMSLLEWRRNLGANAPQAAFSILATDLSGRSLKYASEGIYTEEEMARGLSPAIKARYFERSPTGWRIVSPVRAMVGFRPANLFSPDSQLGMFDVIFCRNVLIYFPQTVVRSIVERFRSMLSPGGALFIGASESLYGISSKFTAVHHGDSVYYQ